MEDSIPGGGNNNIVRFSTLQVMTSHSKKSLKSDYRDIIKRAKKQPGLTEVMKVYGQYSQLVTQSQAYLGELQPTEIFSDSTSTA